MEALSPTPMEIAFSVGGIVAVVFAVFAILQMRRGRWTIGAGVVFIVLSFLIPFSGPVIAGVLTVRQRIREGASAA